MALTALAGDRGYASYLLGSILLQEKHMEAAGEYFMQSAKAGFLPALSACGWLLLRNRGSSTRHQAAALSYFRRAIRGGHKPARIMLANAYLSGTLGPVKRVLGLGLMPFELVRFSVGIRYDPFSIRYFFIVPDSTQPLFNTQANFPMHRRWPH
jgi:TPR repeat protein